MLSLRSSLGRIAGAAVVAAAAACSDGNTIVTDPPPSPSIGIALSAGAMTVAQGASGTGTITVSREAYQGLVSLAVEGAPAGVTATLTPAAVPAGSTTSQLAIAVAGTAAPGNYALVVRASGSGVASKTAPLALTVQAPQPVGSFALSMLPAQLTVQQGKSEQATVNIDRTVGFDAPITLAASGLPGGVTATFVLNPSTSNASTATIAAAADAAPGNYQVTIRGTAAGQAEKTTTLAVQVTPASQQGVSIGYRFCGDATELPIWVAAQDGTGAWQRLAAGANHTYTFNVASGKGGVAYVTQNGADDFDLTVFHASAQELKTSGGAGVACAVVPNGKSVTGTVGGLGALDRAYVAFGGQAVTVVPGQQYFELEDVLDGPRDLFAARSTMDMTGGAFTQAVSRLQIRRDLNPGNGGTLPIIDFEGATAFDPVVRNIDITGLAGDQPMMAVNYLTANGTNASYYMNSGAGSNNRAYPGVPAAAQADGDLHQVMVIATPPGNGAQYSRFVTTYFRNATDRSAPLGPVIAQPTVTPILATGAARVRMHGALPAEYRSYAGASFTQGNADRIVTIGATEGWMGGGLQLDLMVPDFSAVAGWNPQWGLKAGVAATWSLSASGYSNGSFTGGVADGTVVRAGTRSGQVVP